MSVRRPAALAALLALTVLEACGSPPPSSDAPASVPTASEPAAATALVPRAEPTPDEAVDFSAQSSGSLPAAQPPTHWKDQVRLYDVEPGDSVRSIGLQFGVTNETLIWANDLTEPDILTVGQQLKILPLSGLVHGVRPGDTLASVANAYDARLDDVIKANGLKEPYIILIGQELLIPGGYRPLPRKVVAPSEGSGGESVEARGEQRSAGIAAPVRNIPALGNTPQELFIKSIAEAAMDSHERTGVPASVTMAQAILESYWGSSRLASEANNYFGIKAQTRQGTAGVVWFQAWEVIGGRNVVRNEPFRAYTSPADSFVDHGRFLVENPRYSAAMAARGDARQFAREINRAGYATDPAYAAKLIQLMDRYDLYRFDE